jgi:hypothetical protein
MTSYKKAKRPGVCRVFLLKLPFVMLNDSEASIRR